MWDLISLLTPSDHDRDVSFLLSELTNELSRVKALVAPNVPLRFHLIHRRGDCSLAFPLFHVKTKGNRPTYRTVPSFRVLLLKSGMDGWMDGVTVEPEVGGDWVKEPSSLSFH